MQISLLHLLGIKPQYLNTVFRLILKNDFTKNRYILQSPIEKKRKKINPNSRALYTK